MDVQALRATLQEQAKASKAATGEVDDYSLYLVSLCDEVAQLLYPHGLGSARRLHVEL